MYKISIKEMPETERPREKMVLYGPRTLSNSELLAIILRTGNKEQSALELANTVLSQNEDGIRYLTNCTVEELSQIKGIGSSKACQILAAVEIGNRLARSFFEEKQAIRTPKDVVEIFINEMSYQKKGIF